MSFNTIHLINYINLLIRVRVKVMVRVKVRVRVRVRVGLLVIGYWLLVWVWDRKGLEC